MADRTGLFFMSVILNFLCVRADEEIGASCALGTECVLPCDFKNGSDISIHWRKTPGNGTVHSYHSNEDQLQLQHEDYRGRTFLKEVHRGEASLLLRDVRIQDEGTYMCNTSSSNGSSITIVDLQVFVRDFEVVLERQGSGLVCRAEGIYPKPEVNWTFVQPTNEVRTRVEQREDLLYDVYATVSHLGCSDCTVLTPHNWGRASIIEYVHGADYDEAVLRCFAPKCQTNLIWKFHDAVIFSRNGSEEFSNNSWQRNVETVTEFYSLVLRNLGPEHEGNYSCFIRMEKQTMLNVIRLKIHMNKEFKSLSESFRGITAWTLVLMLSMSFLFGYAVHFEMDSGPILQKYRRILNNGFRPAKALSEKDAETKELLIPEEEKNIGTHKEESGGSEP